MWRNNVAELVIGQNSVVRAFGRPQPNRKFAEVDRCSHPLDLYLPCRLRPAERDERIKALSYPQMIAFGFDVGVDHLIVEKLRGLRPPGNTPVVVIQQAAEKPKLSLLIQHLNLHEVRKLASECLDVLVELSKIALDMRTQ